VFALLIHRRSVSIEGGGAVCELVKLTGNMDVFRLEIKVIYVFLWATPVGRCVNEAS
jgi:hypothetical protein